MCFLSNGVTGTHPYERCSGLFFFNEAFGYLEVSLILLTLLSCLTTVVDRMTIDRIVREGLMVPDTGEACALGESFSHVLMGTRSQKRAPDLAMVIASGTSAICTQKKAWEAELLAARTEYQLQQGKSDLISEVKDARFTADRTNHQTARRFHSALQHLEAAFGPIGDSCPTIKEKDEVVYLIGLISGLLAVLHDRAAGGTVGVPLDVLPKVARSATCLDNDEWWQVPQALQAAVWASVPGAGP